MESGTEDRIDGIAWSGGNLFINLFIHPSLNMYHVP